MLKRLRMTFWFVAGLSFLLVIFNIINGQDLAVLAPKGSIARQQADLFKFTIFLSLVVVLPVFIMLFVFAHKYSDKNKSKSKKYTPDWDSDRRLETIWWGVPIIIILILSMVTYKTSHSLDPFKPINANKPPLKIQVVALQWKWLFIYPDQNVALLNQLKLPVDVPVDFEITSDAPMNSFWIPQLGGQIYAMSGMSTQLHLLPQEIGNYRGSSANLSGKGFAGMNFKTEVISQDEFDRFVFDTNSAASNLKDLDEQEYRGLQTPTENVTPLIYRLRETNIYNDSVMKYMMPANLKNSDHELMMRGYNGN